MTRRRQKSAPPPTARKGMCARETLVGFPLRVQSKAALARPGFLHCKKPRAEEHAKKITTRKGGDFCDCPQVLLPALPHIARKGECEGETFAGFPTRVQSPARRRPILLCKIAAPKEMRHTFVCLFSFGAGDEARTRYLELGKVALYQMSYARKRKVNYTAYFPVCQPCIFILRIL